MATMDPADERPTVDAVDVTLDGSLFTLRAVRRVPRDLRDVLDPCRPGERDVVATFAMPGYVLARAARDSVGLLVATCVDLAPADPCPCGSPLQVKTCHGRTMRYDAGW